MPKQTPRKEQSISGGGVKVTGAMGAGRSWQERGELQKIEIFAGVSGGAIASLLFGSGWDIKKIRDKYFELNFNELVSYAPSRTFSRFERFVAKTPLIGKKLSTWLGHDTEAILEAEALLRQGAFKNPEKLRAWLKKIAKEVTGIEDPTFIQWHNKIAAMHDNPAHPNGMKDLRIYSSNLEICWPEEFSCLDQNGDFDPTQPNANKSIVEAIMASAAYPFAFPTVMIDNIPHWDGGIAYNSATANPEVTVLCFATRAFIENITKGLPPPKQAIPKTKRQETNAMLETINNTQMYALLNGPNKHNVIWCNITNDETGRVYSALDFDLTLEDKQELERHGYEGARSYFAVHSPEEARQLHGAEVAENAAKAFMGPRPPTINRPITRSRTRTAVIKEENSPASAVLPLAKAHSKRAPSLRLRAQAATAISEPVTETLTKSASLKV